MSQQVTLIAFGVHHFSIEANFTQSCGIVSDTRMNIVNVKSSGSIACPCPRSPNSTIGETGDERAVEASRYVLRWIKPSVLMHFLLRKLLYCLSSSTPWHNESLKASGASYGLANSVTGACEVSSGSSIDSAAGMEPANHSDLG